MSEKLNYEFETAKSMMKLLKNNPRFKQSLELSIAEGKKSKG